MIRAVTEADAEAIYELLFAARDEIPLSKIETDPKEDWLNCIRALMVCVKSLPRCRVERGSCQRRDCHRANAFKCR